MVVVLLWCNIQGLLIDSFGEINQECDSEILWYVNAIVYSNTIYHYFPSQTTISETYINFMQYKLVHIDFFLLFTSLGWGAIHHYTRCFVLTLAQFSHDGSQWHRHTRMFGFRSSNNMIVNAY